MEGNRGLPVRVNLRRLSTIDLGEETHYDVQPEDLEGLSEAERIYLARSKRIPWEWVK
jgi:hypothetical protein